MQSGSKNWTIGKQRQQQNEQIKTKTKTNKKTHQYLTNYKFSVITMRFERTGQEFILKFKFLIGCCRLSWSAVC